MQNNSPQATDRLEELLRTSCVSPTLQFREQLLGKAERQLGRQRRVSSWKRIAVLCGVGIWLNVSLIASGVPDFGQSVAAGQTNNEYQLVRVDPFKNSVSLQFRHPSVRSLRLNGDIVEVVIPRIRESDLKAKTD